MAPPLRGGVDPATPARTRSELRLELGDQVRTAAFLVSWPLEFEGGPRLIRVDGVQGRARIEVTVVNRSGRDRRARVGVASRDGTAPGAVREMGTLPAGRRATAAFDLDGLRPLDLLAGTLALDFEVGDGGALQDRTAYRFAPLATDLDRSDLLRFLLRLAADPEATGEEIDEGRALVLLRMREDWIAAIRSAGNPYKDDYRSRGAGTALGELVQALDRHRGGFARPEVFRGLGAEIELLAGDLPGIHPFLRKYMKRLARRVENA